MVVLASGDPGFFGIARYLAAEFGREAFTVLPQVSSLQLAFARIGLPWDDGACVSLHGRPLVLRLAESQIARAFGRKG